MKSYDERYEELKDNFQNLKDTGADYIRFSNLLDKVHDLNNTIRNDEPHKKKWTDLEREIFIVANQMEFDAKHEERTEISKVKSNPETENNLKVKYSKYRPSLIPIDALEDMSKVMTDGAKKYGDNNWMKVETERYKDALMRHLIAYLKDPDGLDEESGHPHIAHLLTNAAILDYKFHHKDGH